MKGKRKEEKGTRTRPDAEEDREFVPSAREAKCSRRCHGERGKGTAGRSLVLTVPVSRRVEDPALREP